MKGSGAYMRIKTLTDITNMSFSELVSYEVSSNSSLLLLRLSEKMSIIDHQVKMAENNKICRTSPFYIVRRDGNIYSCYDITSLVSLSFFLKRKKLSREELIRIFIDIAGNLLNCSGYLLDDKRYLIEPDFIFINPETMEINMIYIPAELPDEDRGNGEAVNGEAGNGEVRCEEAGKPVPGSRDNRYFPVIPDAAIEFRNLVYDLMLNRVELKECNTGDYFGRILTYFRNNTYSIQGFISLLLDLLKEETFKEGYDIQTNFSAILPGFEIRPNPDNRPALKETNPGEGALISEKFQKEHSCKENK